MKMTHRILTSLLAVLLTAGLVALATPAAASHHLPGAGITVQPGQDNVDGENFQTWIVIKALERLGYDVKDVQNAKYPALHLAVAAGDVTFMADHWNPLHTAFFENAGGEEKLFRAGAYIPNCAQGYLVDKKTAEKYGITNLGQMKAPEIAKLFDADGDGQGDLAGCPPGWGCERVIEHQMDAFDLRPTLDHNQGEYSAIIAETITRYREGGSILYYTWTPYWVSGVLVPGEDVVWIEVPRSAHPEGRDTELPNGKNYGFAINKQNIVANKAWVNKNPAAKKLFTIMQVPAVDVSAQNLKMRDEGEGGWEAAGRHADAWIKANQATFDSWIEEAKAAAM